MKKGLVRQISVLLAVIITIVVNTLANALPLNGLNTGEISDRFNVFFVPSGYVFSIWGLIYIGLIGYAVYQMLPGQADNPRLTSIAGLFLLSCAANIVWLFFWHYELFPLTLPAMLILLGSLIAIYLRLGNGARNKRPTAEKILVQLTFSVYLGWITVATIANATSLLDYLNWKGGPFSPQAWTAIMLAAAVIIAALMTYYRRDVGYLLVLVWAFAGIAVKFPNEALVSGSAWTATALVALFAVYAFVMRSKTQAR